MTAGNEASPLRLAVLIDGDNASPSIAEKLMAEIARLGGAGVKRIYGDWTRPQLAAWKQVLLRHAIQPVQQFGYATGKNATDSTLIIDAMDLLYTRRFGGFCIVSSDSDFTPLALRLREEGLVVYGFGERKTPPAFVSACDRFLYTEALGAKPKAPPTEKKPESKPENKKPTKMLRDDTKLMNLLRSAVSDASQNDGWADVGAVANHIRKQAPDFDSGSYGYKKLRGLFAATQHFEIEQRSCGGGGNAKAVYVRDKKGK